jgi:drug/metabolite transporter (DMT)-like permease
MQGSMPILVMLGGWIAFRTATGGVPLLGALITLAGVAVIATAGDPARLGDLRINIGDAWMLGACLLYAGYTVFLRNRPAVSGLSFAAGMGAASVLSSIPLALGEAALGQLQWPTAKGWLLILYIAIFPSLLAQLFFMRAVDLIGAVRAGVFINLVPLFGALLAVLIVGEHFANYHSVALVLILGGIAIAERWRSR